MWSPVPPPYSLKLSDVYVERIPGLFLFLWDNPGIKVISSPLASSPSNPNAWDFGVVKYNLLCRLKTNGKRYYGCLLSLIPFFLVTLFKAFFIS